MKSLFFLISLSLVLVSCTKRSRLNVDSSTNSNAGLEFPNPTLDNGSNDPNTDTAIDLNSPYASTQDCSPPVFSIAPFFGRFNYTLASEPIQVTWEIKHLSGGCPNGSYIVQNGNKFSANEKVFIPVIYSMPGQYSYQVIVTELNELGEEIDTFTFQSNANIEIKEMVATQTVQNLSCIANVVGAGVVEVPEGYNDSIAFDFNIQSFLNGAPTNTQIKQVREVSALPIQWVNTGANLQVHNEALSVFRPYNQNHTVEFTLSDAQGLQTTCQAYVRVEEIKAPKCELITATDVVKQNEPIKLALNITEGIAETTTIEGVLGTKFTEPAPLIPGDYTYFAEVEGFGGKSSCSTTISVTAPPPKTVTVSAKSIIYYRFDQSANIFGESGATYAPTIVDIPQGARKVNITYKSGTWGWLGDRGLTGAGEVGSANCTTWFTYYQRSNIGKTGTWEASTLIGMFSDKSTTPGTGLLTPFKIGDQGEFDIPTNAKEIVLANHDSYIWYNNGGAINVEVEFEW